MDRLAKRFKVSTLVILRRIHDAGGFTKEQLWRAYQEELERLRSLPAHGHTVVTHEIAASSTKKIKIPNACFEMLRRERARFVLGLNRDCRSLSLSEPHAGQQPAQPRALDPGLAVL